MHKLASEAGLSGRLGSLACASGPSHRQREGGCALAPFESPQVTGQLDSEVSRPHARVRAPGPPAPHRPTRNGARSARGRRAWGARRFRCGGTVVVTCGAQRLPTRTGPGPGSRCRRLGWCSGGCGTRSPLRSAPWPRPSACSRPADSSSDRDYCLVALTSASKLSLPSHCRILWALENLKLTGAFISKCSRVVRGLSIRLEPALITATRHHLKVLRCSTFLVQRQRTQY